MARPHLEVADVLNAYGDAYIAHHRGHLSRGQLKVMGAIRACRTAALGGHVARCEGCYHVEIAYNSCRNRHCPKCQGQVARAWLEQRQADLLPVPYYHVVFTLPAPVAAVAFQNKAVVYDLLFRTAADTLLTIAADPRHLGARIGLTAVLHTWGSALTHHPHVHAVVPGGGLAPDGSRWIPCRPGFFLPVRVLSRLFRRLFLDRLAAAHGAGRLTFHGNFAPLADPGAFKATLAPLRRAEWVVYAKRPFAGPEAVLAYLSRYTHRVAIANSRLLALDDRGVTFRWKDYRARDGAKGRAWIKAMTLPADEFIRRFLLHVLPDGFHRIRYYGLFASGPRAANIARIRSLLAPAPPSDRPEMTITLDWKSRSRSTGTRTQIRPTPNPPTTSHRRLPAPAAADASQSSSASALGRPRGRVRPPLSGSTRHDPGPEHDRASPIERAAISHPGSLRPRSRRSPSSGCVTRAAQARRLCSHHRGPPPTASRRTIDPVATSLTPSPPGQAARQIPIGLGSVAGAPASRGFLPRRLSNAGPPPRQNRRARAGIRNPSQKRPFRA